MHVVHIDIDVNWRVLRGETVRYVAVCDQLRLTAEGDTFEALLEDMSIAIRDLFRFLASERQIDAFFEAIGVKYKAHIPTDVPVDQLQFDVPFGLLPGPATELPRA